MTATDDLMNEAHRLGDAIRQRRALVSARTAPATETVRAMEQRLTALWTAIRAARASGPASDEAEALRRTRPKWE